MNAEDRERLKEIKEDLDSYSEEKEKYGDWEDTAWLITHLEAAERRAKVIEKSEWWCQGCGQWLEDLGRTAHVVNALPYTLRPLGMGVPRYLLRVDVEYDSLVDRDEAAARLLAKGGG